MHKEELNFARKDNNMEIRNTNSELYHHGILGQKWGIRRYQNPDGSLTSAGKKHYAKIAKKDAQEYARAKMFYGEGAGNRRKLIQATVKERSKDAQYKELFDYYLQQQDMSEHAEKAKNERVRKDTYVKAKRAVRNAEHNAVTVSRVGGQAVRAGKAVMNIYKHVKL